MILKIVRLNFSHVRSLLLAGATIGIVLIAVWLWLPAFMQNISQTLGGDWYVTFRPALLASLRGESPYSISSFFSIPWVLVLYAPFALLPAPFDLIVIVLCGVIATGYVAHRLGAKPYIIALLLTTPQFLWGTIYGNNDWMVALGFVLPPQIGLFFILAKPQIGAPVALFWLVEAWRCGRLIEVVRVFWPVSLTVLACLLIYRGELLHMTDASTVYWNLARFPYLVPVGLILLWRAIRGRKINKAIMAGPFLSPYIGAQSLPVALLGLLPDQTESIIVILSLWVVWFLRGPVP